MSRRMIFAVVFVTLLPIAVFQAQSQTFSRGVPASAMSPEPDGRQHGVPASAVSPVPPQAGVHQQRQFGNTFVNRGQQRRFVAQRDRRNLFVPVPVFYPVYGYGDPSYPVADPYVPVPQEQATAASANADDPAPESGDHELQAAYLQGARDALAHERDTIRKSGDHFADPQQSGHSTRQASASRPAEADPQPAKEDNSPATVFIFKDGHQIETHNFAIVGQTLYDFSNTGLKKVQLADMDKDATTRANDDRGISVKLP